MIPETLEERRKRLRREATRRTRARARGEDIPFKPRGVPVGYRQTVEHVAKRAAAIRGDKHHHWQGDQVSERGGRSRALRMYPDVGPCVECGGTPAERHHIDESTANNDPANIAVLCRRCHMSRDGRLERLRRNPGRGISRG